LLEGVDEIRFKRDEIRIEGSRVENEAFSQPRRLPCHIPWRGPLYVRHDGKVHPCCYMYEEEPMGDLRQQTVMDVWNSPAMIRLRQAHVTGDLEEYPACRNCQAPRPGTAALYGSMILDSLTVRKAVPAVEKLVRIYGLKVLETG
jgi:radical SAM protein with 4Fe4S-binding SPASM domain